MALRYRIRYALAAIFVLLILNLLLHTHHPKPLNNSARHDHSHLYSTRPPRIQHDFPPTHQGADLPRLAAVKAEFAHAYAGYRTRAWMRDGLKPVSGGSYTQYCGWAATLIDALDSLYIMGMWEEWDEAVEAVVSMGFGVAPSWGCSVNPFEMTIRHVGGLLAAFDISGGRETRLRTKAKEVGEMMWQAFGRNGIQCRTILWPRLPGWGCEPNALLSLARLGSQSVEFLRLGTVTGEEKWGEKARWLAEEMERVQMDSSIPGLWPQFFDGTCADGLCDLSELNAGHQTFTLGSAADSAYEYLVKVRLDFFFRTGLIVLRLIFCMVVAMTSI
jgi:mannosyl-oligosaccharide alpha-1,2-mannosidase